MQPTITIRSAGDFSADAALLSPAERAVVPTGLRRDEWIRGRLAMRAALVELLGPEGAGIEIVVAPDAGPLLVGGPPCAVSLSHDARWIAVAAIRGDGYRVGIDLCARSHASRISGLLQQLGVLYDCEPVAAWAALEAVLKLRRWPILELREHALAVVEHDDRLVVRGLGEPVEVMIEATADHVVGWAVAPA